MIIKTYGQKELQENILSISRPFALISINSPMLPRATFHDNPMMKDSLYLTFIDDDNMESNDLIYFSIRHAEEIMYFVDKNKNIVDEIVIQCEMGQSRSTAIAMVLELYLNHNKKASNHYAKYYAPNRRVLKIMKDYFLD